MAYCVMKMWYVFLTRTTNSLNTTSLTNFNIMRSKFDQEGIILVWTRLLHPRAQSQIQKHMAIYGGLKGEYTLTTASQCHYQISEMCTLSFLILINSLSNKKFLISQTSFMLLSWLHFIMYKVNERIHYATYLTIQEGYCLEPVYCRPVNYRHIKSNFHWHFSCQNVVYSSTNFSLIYEELCTGIRIIFNCGILSRNKEMLPEFLCLTVNTIYPYD